MNELQQQLQDVLNNPEMMAQIQNIAGSLSASPTPQEEAPKPPTSGNPIPPDMLQMAMQMAGGSGMDKRQQALLSAMKPYLTKEKSEKLRSAMEAAHLAQLAVFLMGGGNGQGGNHV